MKWKWIAARVFPLALLTFCLVTAKAVAACVDGPDEMRFGFPFFWIMPGPTSLSWVIDWPALAIDLITYIASWTLLLNTALFVKKLSWRPRLLLIGIWAVAILVSGVYVVRISQDVSAGGVSFNRSYECSRIKRYSLELGFPR
jgi:hypothetical protein